MSTSFFVLY